MSKIAPSTAQLAANRANSQLSTGPRTPEGKAASAQNACKHGILARHTLFAKEDPEELEEFRAVFYDKFQPADDYEISLVDLMIDAKWRIARLHRIESVEFKRQLLAGNTPAVAGLLLYGSESCERRGRYESRLLRNHAAYLAELQKLQAKSNSDKARFQAATAGERTPTPAPASPAATNHPHQTNPISTSPTPISAPPPPKIRRHHPKKAA